MDTIQEKLENSENLANELALRLEEAKRSIYRKDQEIRSLENEVSDKEYTIRQNEQKIDRLESDLNSKENEIYNLNREIERLRYRSNY